MKTKNKTLALVEIAVVLCSMLLVATLPGIAADQATQEVSAAGVTTASEDDYVLGIYGNANEDDTIDMRDVTYTKLVIFGKKPETELADAYYDDEVDVLDVVQIKLIILGRESALTIVDANGDDVTVSMPLEKIVVLNTDVAEAIRALGAKDRIVGVTEGMTDDYVFFPDLCEKPSVGKWYSPDTEAILALEPDSIFAFGQWPGPEKLEDLLVGTDITVVRLDFYILGTLRNEMNMLGYLLVEEEKAREYLEWYDEYIDEIDERISGLSEDEKPRVFIDCGNGETERKTRAEGTGSHGLCVRAGGINIAEDEGEGYLTVSVEWILDQNPAIIFRPSYEGGFESDDVSGMKDQYDEIIGLPSFAESVDAVIDERVYVIDDSIMFAPQMPVGLAYIAKWFHPELFADLDLEAMHQEYVDEFCGIDFDVTEDGAFVYPPPES